VIADDVQYPKQSYTNRVKILLGGREQFLIMPVTGSSSEAISEKEFVKSLVNKSRVTGMLSQMASESDFKSDLLDVVHCFDNSFDESRTIAELNCRILDLIFEKLEICTEVVLSSSLHLHARSGTARIIERCVICKATTYLAGRGSHYLDPDEFARMKVRLEVIDYRLPEALLGAQSHLSVLQAVSSYGWKALAEEFKKNRQKVI